MGRLYSSFLKRILDIVCAVIGLVLFCWLYLILAILVLIKHGVPVIYSAERIGRNNVSFKLYKFRSMTNEKDENGKLLPDGERLTKFGRLLRSTSLDELPEIWNILKGDMSFVGPRPWPVSYLRFFTEEEKKRHTVRPGLSGWAQVNGRTAANWDARLGYDLEYVEKISLFLDIRIVFLTLKKIVIRSDFVEADNQESFSSFRKKQWETEGNQNLKDN